MFDWSLHAAITIDGTPLGGAGFAALSSITVVDRAGWVSDSVTLKFSNARGAFDMPEPGAEVAVSMGRGFTRRHMGVYVVDEIEESGPVRQINVTGRARPALETSSGMQPLQETKDRSWADGLTLGDIVSAIAGEAGLEAAVTAAAAAIVPGHVDQLGESDMSVLSRLAARFDLLAKPAGGRLFLGARGEPVNASGDRMPTVQLVPSESTFWSMRRSRGDIAGTVVARYRDVDTGKTETVEVGDEKPVRHLRTTWRSKEEARAAADAEARRNSRAKETLSIELPGRPDLAAGILVAPIGFSRASAGEWSVLEASHAIDAESGFRSSIQCERPLASGEVPEA